ncbi:MAG: hypothetical protein IKB86_05375 [Clostridia bacterium]|nr:hypothetical protein [Clostridia bacterium]
MHKLKKLLKTILYTAYGFFSALYTPSFLSVAFNFTHGAANNPDGELSIPIGIVILLTIIAIDILIIAKTIKSSGMTKFEKVLTILLFVIVKIIGLMVDQDGWKNFIHCFKWKFMQ